jgi:hypothetical protein
MLFLLLGSIGNASDILIIYDTLIKSEGTDELATALEGAGFSVKFSDTDETLYNGKNPSPDSFSAVIHLNGATYGTSMPASGQQALVDYVKSGGGFISTEWNAYEYVYVSMSTMSDLILLDRSSGQEGDLTYNTVTAEAGHPVLDGIPSSFTFSGGANIGAATVFSSDASTVLMTGTGGDDVVVRELDKGRVVSFSHAGNYGSYDTLLNGTIQDLFINAAYWVSTCDIDGDGFDADGRGCGGDDCDDQDPTVNPSADEYCDQIDNNCDNIIDEDAIDMGSWFSDIDGDGYGDIDSKVSGCEQPKSSSEISGDCDDTDAATYPGALEVAYDGIDQDCDGADLCDLDGDGYDAQECSGEDCDDDNAAFSPAATEVWYDGVDQNCDDADDYDADLDGFPGNDGDCNDKDAAINPDAEDTPGDGVDQDCNGEDASIASEGTKVSSCATAAPMASLTLALFGAALSRRRRQG